MVPVDRLGREIEIGDVVFDIQAQGSFMVYAINNYFSGHLRIDIEWLDRAVYRALAADWLQWQYRNSAWSGSLEVITSYGEPDDPAGDL